MSQKLSEYKTRKELKRVAHDLRNALSPIYSYAQLLEAALADKKMLEEVKFATTIFTAAKKLDALIGERLDRPMPVADSK